MAFSVNCNNTSGMCVHVKPDEVEIYFDAEVFCWRSDSIEVRVKAIKLYQ